MFSLSQSNTYFWNITIEFPISGGKFEKATFDAEFKRLSQSQIETWLKKITDGESTDRDFACEILVGWKGVTDQDQDVTYSEFNRDRLFDIPLVVGSIVRAYIGSITGSKAKN